MNVNNSNEIKEEVKQTFGQEEIQDLRCQSITVSNLHEQAQYDHRTEECLNFNILVCGSAGIGKSSFIELFMMKFDIKNEAQKLSKINTNKNQPIKFDSYGNEIKDLNSEIIKEATIGFPEKQIKSSTDKQGKSFKLTMIDSPGYGDKTDIGAWRNMISSELVRRMDVYRNDMLEIKKAYKHDLQKMGQAERNVTDNRIHLVFYFFDGHRSKDQDFISVKEFEQYSNVIPILAKSESFTSKELIIAKENLIKSAISHGVKFYDIKSAVEADQKNNQREVNLITKECLQGHVLSPCPPFAISNPSHI